MRALGAKQAELEAEWTARESENVKKLESENLELRSKFDALQAEKLELHEARLEEDKRRTQVNEPDESFGHTLRRNAYRPNRNNGNQERQELVLMAEKKEQEALKKGAQLAKKEEENTALRTEADGLR